MATRRKELKGIAHAVLDAFVTRYNQVGGYWALGKLYSHDILNGEQGIIIDLLTPGITPHGDEFRGMVCYYARVLAERCGAKQIPISCLQSAKLHLRFNVPIENPKPVWPTAGNPFECRLTIEDDHDRTRSARKQGVCFPHDPNRESKSFGPDTGFGPTSDSIG